MNKEYYENYRKNNLEQIRKCAREWARKNRKPYVWNESRKLIQRRYRLKHKEEIAEKRRISFRKKILTDSNFRLKWLLRNRVKIATRKQSTSKALGTLKLLGCSVEKAREHIQKQFKSGMSWKNHGKVWEIDHIIPISKFDLTKLGEQKKAFNFNNLQPLIKEENRKKGNRTMI